jgi:hypothetical protein
MHTRKRNIWMMIIAAAAILLIAVGGIRWFSQGEPNIVTQAEGSPSTLVLGQSPASAPNALSPGPSEAAHPNVPGASGNMSSVQYDPASIKIGEQLAGLKVIAIEKETHGKGSILTAWEGKIQLSGTYEYLYQDATYNSGEVIFIPDAESALRLPQPKPFEGQAMRAVLHFTQPNEQKKFGPPGSRGTALLTINGYNSVYADILEGTSDSATVASISSVQVTPPPSTELQNSDLKAVLKDFPVMKQIKLQADAATLSSLQEWIYQVNSTMFNSLASSGKRINAEQRQLIRAWLSQAFTDEKALELLDPFVPASEGGYLISGGVPGLKAGSEVKELKDQQLVTEKDGSVTYKVTYVISGTQDAHLTCKLEPVDSQWKIGAYTMSYY